MANGGIIGPNIVTSFGNCTVTSKTSTGSIALQSKTSLIEYVVVAGGGAGGGGYGGGGGGSGRGSATGGAGGSGIIIVRAPGSANLGASPGTNTVTTLPAPAGGCKVATFTVSGTLTT
jgi:hypothetical protein